MEEQRRVCKKCGKKTHKGMYVKIYGTNIYMCTECIDTIRRVQKAIKK